MEAKDFVDLIGHEIIDVTTIAVVLKDRVKLSNNELFEFDMDIEDSINVDDDVVIFEMKNQNTVLSISLLVDETLYEVERI